MSQNPAYTKLTEAELRPYVADMEQVAYARASVLSEGNGRGSRIIDFNNGSGLTFTVVPDRGLNIVEASFRGIPLAFRTPGGQMSASQYQPEGLGWLRTWSGGLLTTCGLRHVGPPEKDPGNEIEPSRGLHGRISAQCAENTCLKQQWIDNRYELSTEGTLREAAMFAENLRLDRRISTALGDNTIYIDDTVTNHGGRTEVFQILYHCNFGYPAIAPGVEIQAEEHPLSARDAEAEKGLATWNVLDQITPGAQEQCFRHQIPAASDGFARISFYNPDLRLKATVAYDPQTLPNLMQWKVFDRSCYALGLEPTNCTVNGSLRDIQDGLAQHLAPGQSIKLRVRLSFDICDAN
jgi:hypothetical protein